MLFIERRASTALQPNSKRAQFIQFMISAHRPFGLYEREMGKGAEEVLLPQTFNNKVNNKANALKMMLKITECARQSDQKPISP